MPPPNDIEQQLTQLTETVTTLEHSVWLLLRISETVLQVLSPGDLAIPRLKQEQQQLEDRWKQRKDCND